ncbi:protein rep (plasmid) [Clostridium perfringens]|jgi:plasmid rolling circle replication initiator protein Rep
MNNDTIVLTKKQEEEISKCEIIDKCKEKKVKNPKFSDYIEPFVSVKMSERIKDCGGFLMLLADLELEHKKLYRGNFCKNRFCPMCSWRMALKDCLEISILMEHLRLEENKEFIFLTLTTPNVTGEELEQAIKEYNKAFKRLMELKEVKAIVKGYIRKLEVTYQGEKYITKKLWRKKKEYYESKGLKLGDLEPNYDTYNPHFHIVIAVNKSYFTDKNYYIPRERWLELWKKSMRDERITQVDVRKAKMNNYKEVYELSKYSAKDSDYLINRKVFSEFYKSLKGKQVLVFGGLFKAAHKMYLDGELEVYKEKDEIEYEYMLYYNWTKKEYENTKLRELTEEEKESLNHKLINEMEDSF